MRAGVIGEDPTWQIAMPKISRSLPRILAEEEEVAAAFGAGGDRSLR
jgi:site-specific recombinase XerD